MATIETFQTERLVAERLRAEHFADLDRMHRDPRVMQTLAPAGHPNGGMLSTEETRQFLLRNLEHWQRYGYGLWIFHDNVDGRFVGRSGLRHTRIEDKAEVELAYALMAEAWAKGLATEMAVAVTRIGLELLGLEQIVCFTLTTNRASRRVMEKAGFSYERPIVHAGLPHVLYRRMARTQEQRTENTRTENREQRTENREQRAENVGDHKERRTQERKDEERKDEECKDEECKDEECKDEE